MGMEMATTMEEISIIRIMMATIKNTITIGEEKCKIIIQEITIIIIIMEVVAEIITIQVVDTIVKILTMEVFAILNLASMDLNKIRS